MERKLNLDIAERVTEFEHLMKRVLPKNIFYKILLSKGLEFDGYREYNSSDDSSNIDWKASVRAKDLLVRKYVEERDLKFMFFIDVGENMVFGSTEKLKCEYAAELSAAIMHLVLVAGDMAGYVLYNDDIVKFKIPKLGTKQFDIFCHEISSPFIYGKTSNLNKVLEGTIPTLDRSTALLFLVSDFIDIDFHAKNNLETLASMFEVVAIIVRDPLDKTLPPINKEIIIENNKTGEKLLINPDVARSNYELNSVTQLNLVKQIFKDCNIDFLELSTSESSSVGIAEFFRERIRRRKE